MIRLRTAILGGLAGLLLLGAAGVFLAELHRLSAIRQHPAWVYRALGVVRDAVVAIDARSIAVPPGFAPEAAPEAAALYDARCRVCHGAPGTAPEDFALGMMPVPPPLVETALRRPPEEIFWFIRNGLKMSGMPAWHLRLSPGQMWRLTGFVEALPLLTPAAYRDLVAGGEAGPGQVPLAGGPPDPERGRIAMRTHACRSCHQIPGLVGAETVVGPPLGTAASRRYVAGVLPNSAEALALWIADPQAVDPRTMMPDLGVPLPLARDMAAYLRTLSPPPATGLRGARGEPAAELATGRTAP